MKRINYYGKLITKNKGLLMRVHNYPKEPHNTFLSFSGLIKLIEFDINQDKKAGLFVTFLSIEEHKITNIDILIRRDKLNVT